MAVATATALACGVVLKLTFPFHVDPRPGLIAPPEGTWGASWESLTAPAAQIQRDALHALARTVTQLGAAALLIAALSLVLHTISRILASWRALAIRCALGATLRHLLRQVGADLATLAVAGFAIGLGAGLLAVGALDLAWPAILTRPAHLAPALTAAAAVFAALAGLVALVAFVMLAALQRGLVGSVSQLHGDHITATGPMMLAQSGLAALQLAALLIVTYGAALFLRNSSAFAPAGGTTAAGMRTAPITWAAGSTVPGRTAGYAALDQAFRNGALAATLSSPDASLSLGRRARVLAICADCHLGDAFIPFTAETVRLVAAGFGAPGVAVLNRAAAFALFPGGTPIGNTIHIGGGSDGTYTVGSIVTTQAPRGLGNSGSEPPVIYLPLPQHPPTIGQVAAPDSVWDRLARLFATVADESAVKPALLAPRPMVDRLREFAAPLDWFGGLCLGLAAGATGIAAYSLTAVMQQMVRLRERDIAIRIALGASPRQVERWVTGRTLVIMTAGVAIGGSGARWVGTLLREQAIQSESGDVLLLGLMVLLFAGLGVLASWLPARRAARVEPAALWGDAG